MKSWKERNKLGLVPTGDDDDVRYTKIIISKFIIYHLMYPFESIGYCSPYFSSRWHNSNKTLRQFFQQQSPNHRPNLLWCYMVTNNSQHLEAKEVRIEPYDVSFYYLVGTEGIL